MFPKSDQIRNDDDDMTNPMESSESLGNSSQSS